METTNYKLGHHLVAFLDVLGQRDKFRGLCLPTNAEEEDRVKEVLRQTAGFVVDLRKVFQTQFEAFESGSAKMRAHTKEPLRPTFVGFSDSFVTCVPLFAACITRSSSHPYFVVIIIEIRTDIV
jgi:hypothetical protein